MNVGKKIQKQLTKSFDSPSFEDLRARFDALETALDPATALFVRQMKVFISKVERSYSEYEDRDLVAFRNIEISSRELSEAYSNIEALNQSISSMVNSLSEGYLVCNTSGLCEGIYSAVCDTIFGRSPTGVHILDLLAVAEDERETARDWLRLTFDERLSEGDVSQLGPQRFINLRGQQFGLKYRLIRADGVIQGLIVIAADETLQRQAQAQMDESAIEALVVRKIVEDRDQFQGFLQMAFDILASLDDLSSGTQSSPDHSNFEAGRLAQVRLDLHSLKGVSAAFYLFQLEEIVHGAELQFASAAGFEIGSIAGQTASKIKAELERIVENHKRIIGDRSGGHDLVAVSRKKLISTSSIFLKAGVPASVIEKFLDETAGCEVRLLMESYRSIVQVSADRLSKQVHPLKITSDDIRIPLEPYQPFFNSLIHLFRNSVAHGIEVPDVRENIGKDPLGTIDVQARHLSETQFLISIGDDGSGISVDRLRQKLRSQGSALSEATDQEILNHLFDLGVSTAQGVSVHAGMGLGLSSIASSVSGLGGKCSVHSTPGKGARFEFVLPKLSWAKSLLSVAS